jgi:replication initiation and membrane attachment protein DnaB
MTVREASTFLPTVIILSSHYWPILACQYSSELKGQISQVEYGEVCLRRKQSSLMEMKSGLIHRNSCPDINTDVNATSCFNQYFKNSVMATIQKKMSVDGLKQINGTTTKRLLRTFAGHYGMTCMFNT